MVAQESRVLSVDPSVDPSKAHGRVGGAEPTYRVMKNSKSSSGRVVNEKGKAWLLLLLLL